MVMQIKLVFVGKGKRPCWQANTKKKSLIFCVLFLLFAFLAKGLFDRACSSEEVNLLIHDELQPDEGFHGLYDEAIDSLEKKLRKVLPNTFYGIHSFIEVSGETALQPQIEKDAGIIVSL